MATSFYFSHEEVGFGELTHQTVLLKDFKQFADILIMFRQEFLLGISCRATNDVVHERIAGGEIPEDLIHLSLELQIPIF